MERDRATIETGEDLVQVEEVVLVKATGTASLLETIEN